MYTICKKGIGQRVGKEPQAIHKKLTSVTDQPQTQSDIGFVGDWDV
jgi:hypothetical protein